MHINKYKKVEPRADLELKSTSCFPRIHRFNSHPYRAPVQVTGHLLLAPEAPGKNECRDTHSGKISIHVGLKNKDRNC